MQGCIHQLSRTFFTWAGAGCHAGSAAAALLRSRRRACCPCPGGCTPASPAGCPDRRVVPAACSHNGIEQLEGLESLVNLKILDVANNRIRRLEGLGTLQARAGLTGLCMQ